MPGSVYTAVDSTVKDTARHVGTITGDTVSSSKSRTHSGMSIHDIVSTRKSYTIEYSLLLLVLPLVLLLLQVLLLLPLFAATAAAAATLLLLYDCYNSSNIAVTAACYLAATLLTRSSLFTINTAHFSLTVLMHHLSIVYVQ
jgi:hypothetical protein